jgi:hypothetical protein
MWHMTDFIISFGSKQRPTLYHGVALQPPACGLFGAALQLGIGGPGEPGKSCGLPI